MASVGCRPADVGTEWCDLAVGVCSQDRTLVGWGAIVRHPGLGRRGSVRRVGGLRMLVYQLTGTGQACEDYRLVTSLHDARRNPARQLAALYRERWGATRSRTRLSELPDRRIDLMSTA